MSAFIESIAYQTELPAGGHWSLRARRGTIMRLTDLQGGANLGMLLYNPENLLERYNAPDTLKCQHSFRLTQGHCLYSDMGRIMASIVEDSAGWHDTVCGNSHAQMVSARWGKRDYQHDRNHWHQNGHDAFLVELVKYGLGLGDLAANINWFSRVEVDAEGGMHLMPCHNEGRQVTLRFDMDCLVLMHACPHPLDQGKTYPRHPVGIELGVAKPVAEDDICCLSRPENARGFLNNRLYHIGLEP